MTKDREIIREIVVEEAKKDLDVLGA
jgi:hypothetical protein